MVFWGYCKMDKCTGNRQGLSRRRITVAVIIDVTLFLISGYPGMFILFFRGTPSERGFLCDDPVLSLPYRPETVSTSVLIIAGFSISIILVLLVELLNTADKKCHQPCQSVEGPVYCVRAYSVFLVGFVLQELIVEFVKNQLGSLRPDFFDVCRPHFNRSLSPGLLASTRAPEECMKQAKFGPADSRFLPFYIQRRLHVTFSRIVKLFLQFGLVFFSLICGLGRIQDNTHHPADVIVGFLVGLTTAILVVNVLTSRLLLMRSRHAYSCGIAFTRAFVTERKLERHISLQQNGS